MGGIVQGHWLETRKGRLYLLASVAMLGTAPVYVGRLSDDCELRIADFTLGSSRTGVGTEHPALRHAEPLWLLFKVRGCTADKDGMCRGTLTVRITDSAGREMPPLSKTVPFHFQKKTFVTHLDYKERFALDSGRPGDWKLHLEATDAVAQHTVSKDVDFTVGATP